MYIIRMDHNSAVKFDMGIEKNFSNLLTPESQEVGEKVEKIGPCPLRLIQFS